MCDFCRRGISITLFYPSHNVAHNLLRRHFYSNKQNCLFSSKCKMKIKFFILKCQLSIFHNLGQMRCPENQYLSENAWSCKSCFWNFCNFVCLADFPVYCPFSQQPTWFWIFFLLVVARIFCIFESFVCLEDISVYAWFWNFRAFRRCPCLLPLPATTTLVRLVFVFVICCSKDFVYFWNFCVFGWLACLFSQPTATYVVLFFLLFVVVKILCIFETFLCFLLSVVAGILCIFETFVGLADVPV